jgi:hypothetical protein
MSSLPISKCLDGDRDEMILLLRFVLLKPAEPTSERPGPWEPLAGECRLRHASAVARPAVEGLRNIVG